MDAKGKKTLRVIRRILDCSGENCGGECRAFEGPLYGTGLTPCAVVKALEEHINETEEGYKVNGRIV